MGSKTKIDWADSTWNPVTGCFHNCKYCYARKMVTRFGTPVDKLVANGAPWLDNSYFRDPASFSVLDEPIRDDDGKVIPYPSGFYPTLYRYLLDKPQHWAKPRTIFVCSMADLFGDWLPDDWIEEVFEACAKAPQHKYLFLTKNPKRYLELAEAGKLPQSENMWYGTTATAPNTEFFYADKYNTFLSIEPILEDFGERAEMLNVDWLILGAETGNRKGKVIPEKAWIENICRAADKSGVPVLMKNSLVPTMGENSMRREFPWQDT